MSRPLSGADALRTLMPVSPLSRGNRCLPTYSTAIRTELKRSLAGCCGAECRRTEAEPEPLSVRSRTPREGCGQRYSSALPSD